MGIVVERQGPVGVVTLDWPETRNALDLEQMLELAATIEEVGNSDDAAAVVLTGNGAFCAGANLKSVASRASMPEDERRSVVENVAHRLIRAVVQAPIPIIAAVDGPAVGLGFDLALSCCCRLVGPHGWLAQGWGRVGLIPGAGGELMLRLLNPSILWRLLEDQPRMSGADAERWGIGELVVAGSAVDAARRRAATLAELPRDALLAYVELSRSALRRELDEHLKRCAEIQPRLLTGAQAARRMATVLEQSRRSARPIE